MNHCRPWLLYTTDGYRSKLPWPAQPPMAASRKAARDGHWSRPSSDFAGGGAKRFVTFWKYCEAPMRERVRGGDNAR